MDLRLDRSMFVRVVLLFVAFIVPLTGAGAILIGQQSMRIGLTERELDGILLTKHTIAVVCNMRALRDRLAFRIDGASLQAPVDCDTSAARGRMAVARDVGAIEIDTGRDLDVLYAYGRGDGAWSELRVPLEALRAQWAAVPARPDGARAVTAALATATNLFGIIARRSELDTDPDSVTARLLDAYTSQLPTMALHADEAKGTSLEGTPSGTAGLDRSVAAALEVGQARHAYDVAREEILSAADAGVTPPQFRADVAMIDARFPELVASIAKTKAHSPIPAGTSQRTRIAANAVIDAAFDTERTLDTTIDALLTAREDDEQRSLLLMKTEAALAVLVGLWIAVLLARTIRDRDRRELERAQSEAERLTGELERQRMLEDLAVTEAHFRAVFDRSSIGVAILDRDGHVLRSNRALHDMLDTVDGRRIGSAHPEFERLLAGEIESFTTEFEPFGEERGITWEATLSLVRDDDGQARFAISMIKDVTERKRIDDRLRYEATHDSLSGLPNRSYFCERVRSTFFGDRQADGVPAVLFVDLDEFKFVNDSLGHEVGDRVLVATGERLRASTMNSDTIARFGGDEFAVLLCGRHSRDELEATVHKLGRSLAEPLSIDGREIFVTASIGVAYVHGGYHTVEEVLRDADTAMYYAKSTGRARSAVFDVSMHDQATRRLDIATQLRRALEREQFYLVYQPVVSLATGTIQSCEVLLRWESPELGLVSPVEFIPIAEELGLIVPIGRYVLDRACRQFAEWRDGGIRHPSRISVNASVREIVQTDFVDTVEATMARYDMRPGDLILEVTETAILSSGKFSHGALDRLKSAGVGLAIDDFGTGYSSLRYLQQFPFDQLKIDRSFVGGADGRLASEPIVTMLLTLAKSCGVGVVAEGVETPTQAARLRALGCSSAQGYLYGRPCRAATLPELFRRETDFAS